MYALPAPPGGTLRLIRCLPEAFHHEPGATARDVRDHRGTPMELGDTAQVDGEGQHHVLALTQAEVRCLDEYPGRAQVHGFAELASSAGHRDVHDGARAMPGVQSAFHCDSPCSWFFYIFCLGACALCPVRHDVPRRIERNSSHSLAQLLPGNEPISAPNVSRSTRNASCPSMQERGAKRVPMPAASRKPATARCSFTEKSRSVWTPITSACSSAARRNTSTGWPFAARSNRSMEREI